MNKIKNKRWNIRRSPEELSLIGEISEYLGISLTVATVIVNRGYKTVKEAEAFIKKNQEILHDPFLLNDMDRAIDRIVAAINRKEKITIYGDYDVDGVTSVSILYLYLERLGAKIEYYIPCR